MIHPKTHPLWLINELADVDRHQLIHVVAFLPKQGTFTTTENVIQVRPYLRAVQNNTAVMEFWTQALDATADLKSEFSVEMAINETGDAASVRTPFLPMPGTLDFNWHQCPTLSECAVSFRLSSLLRELRSTVGPRCHQGAWNPIPANHGPPTATKATAIVSPSGPPPRKSPPVLVPGRLCRQAHHGTSPESAACAGLVRGASLRPGCNRPRHPSLGRG
jgi:hypothetical protein